MYMYIYICICICMCIHMRKRERERERERERANHSEFCDRPQPLPGLDLLHANAGGTTKVLLHAKVFGGARGLGFMGG